MNPKTRIVGYLLLFTFLTTIISVAALHLLMWVYNFYWWTLEMPTLFLYPLIGLLNHTKLHGTSVFLKPDFTTREASLKQMRIVYLRMFIAFIISYFIIESNWPVFAHVFSPILAFAAGAYTVLGYFKSSSNEKNKKTEYSQKPNGDFKNQPAFSVLRTGDDIDQPPFNSHGKAWWISDRLKNKYTDNINDQPTFKGLWIGGGFFHHKEGNLVSVAPPGTGKGAALIIPNLLWKRDYKHSFVVFDPKGTNACITARFRKQQGDKVIIIDPMNLQRANRARHGIPASNFNPLDHIGHDIFNGTAQIANLLIPDDPNGEKFWNQDARNLVQSILMHIMTDASYVERRNLITFYKLMLTGDFFDLFEAMILNDSLDGAISDFASGFTDMMVKSEQTFSSVRSVANGSIKWLSNPALQACMKTSDFNPDDLENGGVSLYLCQPIQNKEGFATFSRLIIGFCLRANSKPAARPKAWVYYLLDEFPTMGIFPEVIECLAYSREYRMRLWIFAQSLSQLDQIYKTEGRNQILGNARVLQAFGVTDHITQDYISKRIGNKTVKIYTTSHSTGSSSNKSDKWTPEGGYNTSTGHSSGTSNNESFIAQPLITTEEVQYDPNIITVSEWGPMRLSRWQYWQKDLVKGSYLEAFNDGRADRNPNIETEDDIEEEYEDFKRDPIKGPEGEGQFTI